uniref:Uncharacterized protein n=1 Tax=Rhizophora mucronata TaxID=61149 RepID=A0A2P2Q0W7_RHIMU
MVITDCKSN